MAGTNEFKPFATDGAANVLSQAAYAALTSLISNGFQSGVADSSQVNKVLRQAAFGTAALGKIIADANLDAVDDGDLATFVSRLLSGIRAGAAQLQIQPVSASVAANALTLTLSPTALDFRSATLTSGTINSRTISSALSLVVPSGATLGTTSGQATRLMLLAIDNAGTVELAVVNLAGGLNLDEAGLISTTAISAGAGSAGVIYSTTARSNVPYRVVGFVDVTEATAGTWATAPTTVQGSGGQSIAALNSLGYGQTWQDVAASRSAAVTYYNTTGRTIKVTVNGNINNAGAYAAINVNGITVPGSTAYSAGAICMASAEVPPNASYQVVGVGGSMTAVTKWSELR